MNNLLSYCGLVEARISASEKYLPVCKADFPWANSFTTFSITDQNWIENLLKVQCFGAKQLKLLVQEWQNCYMSAVFQDVCFAFDLIWCEEKNCCQLNQNYEKTQFILNVKLWKKSSFSFSWQQILSLLKEPCFS